MSSIRDDFDLLLSAPSPVEAQMAQSLLEEHGIPSLVHGKDRDFAELGYTAHAGITRPDVYVPKGAKDRALSLLRTAWDKQSLAEARPSETWDAPGVLLAGDRVLEIESSKSTKNLWIWIAFLLALSAVAATLVYDHLASRG